MASQILYQQDNLEWHELHKLPGFQFPEHSAEALRESEHQLDLLSQLNKLEPAPFEWQRAETEACCVCLDTWKRTHRAFVKKASGGVGVFLSPSKPE